MSVTPLPPPSHSRLFTILANSSRRRVHPCSWTSIPLPLLLRSAPLLRRALDNIHCRSRHFSRSTHHFHPVVQDSHPPQPPPPPPPRGGRQQPGKGLSAATSAMAFWGSAPVWRRAGVNTFRCLVGCSIGDFSTMWFLQSTHSELGVGVIMASSIIAGLTTSISLETLLLHLGRDRLPWVRAARTAVGMSFVSMLGMEAVQNLVDFHLTAGLVALHDPRFWAAAAVSMLAGFLAPLPYNYVRLKRFGRACH